jgi:hypothetical protein
MTRSGYAMKIVKFKIMNFSDMGQAYKKKNIAAIKS